MITIITINYNTALDTIACVKSVLDSEYQYIRVLLIDNNSESKDYQKLSKEFGGNSRVEILREKTNLGYVRGINHGIKLALGYNSEYILIMNNDTILDKKAIGYLIDAAKRHENKAIISGKVYYFDQPDVLQHTGVYFKDKRYLTTTYPGKNEVDIGQFDEEAERDSLDDVFWLLPAQIVQDVGYYCDYFYLYAEQGDYAQRARRNGYKLIFTPKAKIWHKVSMSSGKGNPKALPIYYWRGQGMFIFQYRNLKRRYFYQLMIALFLKYITKSIICKGDEQKAFYALLRGYFYGFKWMFFKRSNNGFNPYLEKKKS